jgi:hypothetical protein
MTRRRLWLDKGESIDDLTVLVPDKDGETYDSILRRFSQKSPQKSLVVLASNALVVGQEFILTCLLLARHRVALWEEAHQVEEEANLMPQLGASIACILLALLLVILYNSHSSSAQSRQGKVQQRLTDAIFMAILLRFLAAVLKTLTSSYSSDTVNALAVTSLLLHLLAADYFYANGEESFSLLESSKRPTFRGGTISLTAAFFGTTLLASRLESNASVYVFVSSSVVLFALYPAARHQVAIQTQHVGSWGTFTQSKLTSSLT